MKQSDASELFANHQKLYIIIQAKENIFISWWVSYIKKFVSVNWTFYLQVNIELNQDCFQNLSKSKLCLDYAIDIFPPI